jgi:cytochrome c biogenesis protein CcmG/thiol:disulfide interchange protein DsbE
VAGTPGPLAFETVSAKGFTATLSVLALIGLLGFGLLTKGGENLAVGDPAPDKTLPYLDGSGEGRISDYRGQWVLVNFWASWCEPCREEAPELEDFYRENRADGFTVLGINLDDASPDAEAFVDEFGLTYPQIRDGDGRERRDAFGMTGFPESFLVDPEGRIALIRRGPVTADYLNRYIEPIISGEAAE